MKNNTIFFLTIPLYGHVFPVLDVINKIGKEGYNTYCFVNDFFAEYIKNDNEIILGKDFPAEVGMNYMKFDVFSEENMEQMNKCYAELIKSYGGQNVL